MYCVRCGSHNPPEANFCFRCGTALAPSGPAIQVEPPVQTPTPLPPPQPFSSAASPFQPTLQYPLQPPPAYYPPPYGYYPAPYGAAPAIPAPPQVVELHPLARDTFNLPYDLAQTPRQYYSYLDPQGRVVFARRARFGTRLGAGLLDLLILSLPYFVLVGLIGAASLEPGGDPFSSRRFSPEQTGWLLLMSYSLLFGYFYFTGISSGQSLGKRATRLKVIRLDGRQPDRWTALLRYLPGYALSTNIFPVSLLVLLAGAIFNSTAGLIAGLAVFGWGFWWSARGPLHLAWHDRLARTLVVDTREYVEGVHFIKIAGPAPAAAEQPAGPGKDQPC